MVYVMSDLHGRYDLYQKMLDKLPLAEGDTLYILGDFVDRGNSGFKIVLDLENRKNIIPLMGNHDAYALMILNKLSSGVSDTERERVHDLVEAWMIDGGRETLKEFLSLSAIDKSVALGIMDGFRDYALVSIGEKHYFLCHGGIKNYSPDRPIDGYQLSELVFERADYSRPLFSDPAYYLVTGHTPTAAIEGGADGKIYIKHNHIAVDCGAVFGYGLGCICLDTMQEFYVK